MSQARHQLEKDAARLRNAADRIDHVLAECRKLQYDNMIAVQSLRIIATWAEFLRPDEVDEDSRQIRERALDTLRRMGEKVCGS